MKHLLPILIALTFVAVGCNNNQTNQSSATLSNVEREREDKIFRRQTFEKFINTEDSIIESGENAFQVMLGCVEDEKGTDTQDYFYHILPDSITNFMDLDINLGMERDTNSFFTQTDSIIDKLSNISKMEKKALRYVNEYKYYVSLGLYMDTIFATKEIHNHVLNFMDSLLVEAINYIAPEHNFAKRYTQNQKYGEISIQGLNNYWENIFNDTFNENNNTQLDSTYTYTELSGVRYCTVAHLIYENDTISTYAFISCYDYNGSLGYKKSADYITFDKRTSIMLTINDIISKYNKHDIEQALGKYYQKEAIKNGFEPKWTGKDLLPWSKVAQIGNYILFYYQPYTIGCGAEGQYNLIIKLD